MKTERSIIFSGEMVRAILDGRKTQTRRVIRPQPALWFENGTDTEVGFTHIPSGGGEGPTWPRDKFIERYCPYGVPGDRLWIIQGARGDTRAIPFETRFWGRVIKTANCWEWMGRVNRKKYGLIRRGPKSLSTHRVSWEMHNGPIPNGLHVLHQCDMPWCVNPSHLKLGTNDDNIADKMKRGRHQGPRGEMNPHAQLSWEQVEEIRALYWEQNVYQKDIAVRFNICQPTISKIVNDRRWTKRPGELPVLGNRTLEVIGVRVERVQDISGHDTLVEGVDLSRELFPTINTPDKALRLFPRLWDSINAKRGYSFAQNPFVWVIEFKRMKP